MTASHGIPTTYRDTNFRSRLEARWAALFDLIGWPWVYEPLDTSGYIPDFLITGSRPFFVEVGDCITEPNYREKSQKGDRNAGELGHDLLVVGVSPLAPFTSRCVGPSDNLTAGWFGEYMDGRLTWDAGLWGECHDCGMVGVVHSMMSYVLRPCGHHQSGGFGARVPGEWLTALWRRSGSDTQWAARRPQSVGDILRGLS